jgi:hypothetical protein
MTPLPSGAISKQHFVFCGPRCPDDDACADADDACGGWWRSSNPDSPRTSR